MHKSLATLGMSLAAVAIAVTMPALAASAASASPVSAMVATPQQTATPIKKGAGKGGAKRERHPAIQKAIAALERAKYDMNHASHDFGGHRADALAATDKAIEQLKLALNYDKK
jgi:hypothetical protein